MNSPIITLGTGRSGSSVISELLMRNDTAGWPSNYSDKFPGLTSINLVNRVFDNFIWTKIGQKPQHQNVSVFNKLLPRMSESWNLWKHLLHYAAHFHESFMYQESPSPEDKQRAQKYFT